MSAGGTVVAVADRYRLDQLIATGHTAEVWRASDMELSRTVVVKLVRSELARDAAAIGRFRDHARLAASVVHQGIVRVFDYGEPDSPDSAERPYLVMEFVDGPPLGEVLTSGQHLPERTLAVLSQASAAIAAAHRVGFAHGELSARKILLAPGGVVKLIDFGCAEAAGTAAAAADLYALGLLCCQCLTGKLPSGPAELRLAACPPALAELISKLIAADPALRLTSAAEVAKQAAALRPAQPPVPVHSDHSSQIPPAPTAAQLPAPMLSSAGGPRTAPAPPASPQPSAFWQEVSRHPRKFPTRTSAIVAVALAAIAVVAAVKFNGGPRAAGSVQPAMVRVDAGALTGQPVSTVRLRLHRLGLIVVLRWLPTDRVPPGRVLSVRPAGLVPAHSTVTVIGSRPVPVTQPGASLAPHVSASPRSAHHARRPGGPAPGASPSPSASPGPSSNAPASSPPAATSPPPGEPGPSPSDPAPSSTPSPSK